MPRPSVTPEQRDRNFWARVRKTGTCWLWTGFVRPNGYGLFAAGPKRQIGAHRWAYERFVGPIPDGLDLDHLCRVRHCVNPAHLEPVTRRENARRGLLGDLMTHCVNGHPRTPENLMPNGTGKDGTRHWRCRPCYREQRERDRDKINARKRARRRRLTVASER